MFYHLLYPLHTIHGLGFLNVFRYLTFRSAYAAITALLVSFLAGPHVIHWLRSRGSGRRSAPRDRSRTRARRARRRWAASSSSSPSCCRPSCGPISRTATCCWRCSPRCGSAPSASSTTTCTSSRACAPGFSVAASSSARAPLGARRRRSCCSPSRRSTCRATWTTVPFLKFNYVELRRVLPALRHGRHHGLVERGEPHRRARRARLGPRRVRGRDLRGAVLRVRAT